MPRSWERDTEILFTEGIKLHKHNLLVQERQVLRSPFMCVSLRKQQTAYVAAVSVPCWVLGLLQAWVPTHLSVVFAYNSNYSVHRKRYYRRGVSFKHPALGQGCAMKRITSNAIAYRHTSERISQHSNIRRANLYLVCIKYLCTKGNTRRFSSKSVSNGSTTSTTRIQALQHANGCVGRQRTLEQQ